MASARPPCGHVAERLALDDIEGFSAVVSSTAALLTLLGVSVAAVVAAIGLVAAGLFNVTAEQAALLTQLLLIGAVMQLWSWPAATAIHVLGGLERYDLVARTSVLTTLGNVAAIGLVLVTGAGPVQLMLASAAGHGGRDSAELSGAVEGDAVARIRCSAGGDCPGVSCPAGCPSSRSASRSS